jgi:hypothetical protein
MESDKQKDVTIAYFNLMHLPTPMGLKLSKVHFLYGSKDKKIKLSNHPNTFIYSSTCPANILTDKRLAIKLSFVSPNSKHLNNLDGVYTKSFPLEDDQFWTRLENASEVSFYVKDVDTLDYFIIYPDGLRNNIDMKDIYSEFEKQINFFNAIINISAGQAKAAEIIHSN